MLYNIRAAARGCGQDGGQGGGCGDGNQGRGCGDGRGGQGSSYSNHNKGTNPTSTSSHV